MNEKNKGWANAFPNNIAKVTKYMGVCEKHCQDGYQKTKNTAQKITFSIKGFFSKYKQIRRRENFIFCAVKVKPPSVFKGIPNCFSQQTLMSKPSNLKKRNIDSNSRVPA